MASGYESGGSLWGFKVAFGYAAEAACSQYNGVRGKGGRFCSGFPVEIVLGETGMGGCGGVLGKSAAKPCRAALHTGGVLISTADIERGSGGLSDTTSSRLRFVDTHPTNHSAPSACGACELTARWSNGVLLEPFGRGGAELISTQNQLLGAGPTTEEAVGADAHEAPWYHM